MSNFFTTYDVENLLGVTSVYYKVYILVCLSEKISRSKLLIVNNCEVNHLNKRG